MRLCFLGDAGHVNLLSWIRYLADPLGHEIHVITFNPPCEEAPSIHFHPLRRAWGRNKLRYLCAAPEAAALVKRIRPDLLIAYRLTSYGFLAGLTGFRPLVAVAQGTDLVLGQRSSLQRLARRFVLGRADLLQTWAPHMNARLVALGADPVRIIAFPKGVDTDLFRGAGRRAPARTVPCLISTRQLRRTYRHDVVLTALPRVIERAGPVRHVVCGEGEDRAALEALAGKLGLRDRVEFLGRVGHVDLAAGLREADVYVSMQPTDGVSSSLLEAMASGAFPVVTDIEANRIWIHDGENGFLTPPGDADALADRLIEALARPGLRDEAMRRNAAIVEERGSMRNNMRRMTGIYSDLVARHAHASREAASRGL